MIVFLPCWHGFACCANILCGLSGTSCNLTSLFSVKLYKYLTLNSWGGGGSYSLN
ncbi:unnamed protein product [Ixodes pacificus]